MSTAAGSFVDPPAKVGFVPVSAPESANDPDPLETTTVPVAVSASGVAELKFQAATDAAQAVVVVETEPKASPSASM
ncbi:MAG: hypothetical protein ACO3QC_13325 [Phycisphaerales bacterium]